MDEELFSLGPEAMTGKAFFQVSGCRSPPSLHPLPGIPHRTLWTSGHGARWSQVRQMRPTESPCLLPTPRLGVRTLDLAHCGVGYQLQKHCRLYCPQPGVRCSQGYQASAWGCQVPSGKGNRQQSQSGPAISRVQGGAARAPLASTRDPGRSHLVGGPKQLREGRAGPTQALWAGRSGGVFPALRAGPVSYPSPGATGNAAS